jgi:hypothetical protein
LLPNKNDASKVRDLRHRGDHKTHRIPMKPARHIAIQTPSRKRDASLRACERRDALSLRGLRNYFGTTHID